MRLDFNVLWVDDQPDSVQAQIKAIMKQMEDEGFNFQPKQLKSVGEVKQLIAEDVFTDEVDLILVDWDLGGEVKGQNVIAEIRDSIRYKDVVFYSAQTTPKELRRFVFEANLEGIYCTSREDLVDEVVGVFESLVKKVLDLDHTRGIVMGATSDIDYMVSECLTVMHDGLNEDGKQEMLREALNRIGKKVEDYNKNAIKLQDATSMAELFGAHFIFTANDRLRILTRVLENSAHKSAQPMVKEYMKRVVPERNILGHQVLVPNGKSKEVIDSNGKSISLEKVRELRCLILKLRADFRDLLAALRTPS